MVHFMNITQNHAKMFPAYIPIISGSITESLNDPKYTRFSTGLKDSSSQYGETAHLQYVPLYWT